MYTAGIATGIGIMVSEVGLTTQHVPTALLGTFCILMGEFFRFRQKKKERKRMETPQTLRVLPGGKKAS